MATAVRKIVRIDEDKCDGCGLCVPSCAEGAHAAAPGTAPGPVPKAPEGGCPGSMMRLLHCGASAPPPGAPVPAGESAPSALRHWPVQLALLPERGPIWDDADVLLAADCVPVVMPDFHRWLLVGKTVAVACPKLDDTAACLAKLTRIFAANSVRSVTVAHMEVPCCFGLKALVEQALTAAGKGDIPVRAVTIGLDGRVKE
jgi:ferredoxin